MCFDKVQCLNLCFDWLVFLQPVLLLDGWRLVFGDEASSDSTVKSYLWTHDEEVEVEVEEEEECRT